MRACEAAASALAAPAQLAVTAFLSILAALACIAFLTRAQQPYPQENGKEGGVSPWWAWRSTVYHLLDRVAFTLIIVYHLLRFLAAFSYLNLAGGLGTLGPVLELPLLFVAPLRVTYYVCAFATWTL